MHFTMPTDSRSLDLELVKFPVRQAILDHCAMYLPLSALDRARRAIAHAEADNLESRLFAYLILSSGEVYKVQRPVSVIRRDDCKSYNLKVTFQCFNVLKRCTVSRGFAFDTETGAFAEVYLTFREWDAGDKVNFSIEEGFTVEEIRS